MSWTVSQVASLAHLTVRTLHHYDRIGLASPSSRSEAGYRLYGPEDLVRLQQVLFFRELGFPLAEIRVIMTAPDFDRHQALQAQRTLLIRNVGRMQAMISAVDRALSRTAAGGGTIEEKEMFAMFEPIQPKEYAEEARQRWGHTEVWKESQRRTRKYGKKEWEAIQKESEAIILQLATLLGGGVPATAAEVLDLAEAYRVHIERWFYPCSPDQHECLGKMYVQDERFTAFYERYHAGLAQYLCDAIIANAQRQR